MVDPASGLLLFGPGPAASWEAGGAGCYHAAVTHTLTGRLRELVLERLERTHPDLKPTVARRAAGRIGRAILASWATCWDPVHIGGTRAVVETESLLRERIGPLVDLACRELFHGHVVPVQRVLELVGEARSAALGRCVCRASSLTSDLEQEGRIWMPGEPEVVREHCAELVEVWARVCEDPTDPTAPELRTAFARLSDGDAPPEDRLGRFWRETWPWWELLLDHDALTPEWRDNMARHGKARPIHLDLLRALVSAQHAVRGSIFTAMEAAEVPYAICTCPGPENDGGCSLVNWYYAAGLDGALFPNTDDGHGQLRDPTGAVLPCAKHPERASRPCLGCGCRHEGS